MFSVEKQWNGLPSLPPDAPIRAPSTKVEEKILEITEEIDSKLYLSSSVLMHFCIFGVEFKQIVSKQILLRTEKETDDIDIKPI